MTILERIKMFSSTQKTGLSVTVVEKDTVLGDQVVNDANMVIQGSNLYLTQKNYEDLRMECSK